MNRLRTASAITLAAALLLAAGASPALAGATFLINNTDPPGQGFNDPSPRAPIGGNPGTTLGQQRLIAFQYAADLWGSILDSDVPIVIQGSFQPLACTPAAGTLGAAGTIQIFANFPGATFPNIWYHSALANRLAGADLTPGPFDPGLLLPPFNDDIVAFFNSDIGTNPACLTGRDWYYGLDNNHGNNFDLVHVLLHEFAHGLGFANFVTETTGASPGGLGDIYSQFTLDTTTGLTWNQKTQAQRQASALNCSNIVWNGANVTANVPIFIGKGLPSATINAPSGIAGARRVGPAAFGPALTSPGVTGNVVLALDPANAAGPSTTDGCSPLTNAAAVAGNIALIDRGTCGFLVKVANAQAAGATAVLIADNVNACPPAGLGGIDPTIIIPSARITLADGNAIKANLPGVSATLGVNNAVYAGANAAGQAQIFASNPVQQGSSLSHFDTIAFPNLLMEPAINADLPQNGTDLTSHLLVDEGWAFMSIMIDGCDTGVPNLPLPEGGTIESYVVQFCAANPPNHGQFVSCVNQRAKELRNRGFITQHQRNELQHCAARADIP